MGSYRNSIKVAPCLLAKVVLVAMVQAGYAQTEPFDLEQPSPPLEQEVLPPVITPLEATPTARITDVVVTEIEDGIQVVLVTANADVLEVFQFEEENRLIVDLAGAELALADGGTYGQLDPVPSVASLTLEQRGSEVQMTIVGVGETAPVAYLERLPEALMLDIVTAEIGDTDDNIEFTGSNLRIIVAADPLPSNRVDTVSGGSRTDTDLLELPRSVGAITEDTIDEQGADTLGQTLTNVSGVNSGRAATGLRATTAVIRGFETNNVLRNGLRDDTLRIGSGINNVQTIEILKGPASVLYGPGNLGGTINLVTKEPLPEPSYEFEVSTDSNELYGGALDITGPLTDDGSIGYRLNMAYESRGSFRDFETSEFFFVAPTFEFVNTDRTSLLVDIEYLENSTESSAPGLPALYAIGAEGNEDPVLNGLTPGDEQFVGTIDLSTNIGEPDLNRSEATIARLGVRLSHKLSADWTARAEFLGSFQETPEDSFIVGTGYIQERGQPQYDQLQRIFLNNISSRDVYTLNANVVGNIDVGGFDQTLLFGVEFSHEDSVDRIFRRLDLVEQVRFRDPPPLVLEPFLPFTPNYDRNRFIPEEFPDELAFFEEPLPGTDSVTERTTLGLYGQAQLNLADVLFITAGGRFDFADQFFQDSKARLGLSRDPITTYDTAFSPSIGAVLKPVDDVSLYASYTESFRPTIGQDPRGQFIPETGKQFEAGLKARLFDDNLLLTLAYFDLRRANVVTQNIANDGLPIQVGEQASEGAEFELVGEILPGWNISANYAYIDARVTEDLEIEQGTGLLNAAKHTANLWTSYEIQGGDLKGLGAAIGLSFLSDRNGDLFTPFVIPEFTRTDASIFYRREHFSAQLNFRNVFDVRYFESARGQFRVNPGAPFSVEASLKWEF